MTGGDSLVAHPRGCRSRSLYVAGIPGRPPHPRWRACRAAACGAWTVTAGRESGAVKSRPPTSSIPDAPGSYQFLDADGRGPLRRQGQVAAAPAGQLLGRPGRAPATDRPDGGPGRSRRMGRGRHRGRRADPRALAHPGPQAPLQRPAEGRQELSLAGGDGERGVAASGGLPGPQAQGGAVLRPLRPRRCAPRDARPLAAQLPHAHLLGRQVQATPAPRPPVPALRHRALLGPLRGRGGAGALRADGRGPHAVPVGRDRAGGQPVRSRDGGGFRPLEFERAARLRDRLVAVHKAAETQQMVSDQAEDLDLIGIAEDELEAAIQVFHVRRGRVVGRSGSVADKVEDLSAEQFMGRVLQELYGATGAEVPAPGAGPGDARVSGGHHGLALVVAGRPGAAARALSAATSGRCTRQ